jgi:hypothetical protein
MERKENLGDYRMPTTKQKSREDKKIWFNGGMLYV